tara:strand:- start:896 stop:1114 length:219 start_codon:yes stop_codon:yes gene_type:complete
MTQQMKKAKLLTDNVLLSAEDVQFKVGVFADKSVEVNVSNFSTVEDAQNWASLFSMVVAGQDYMRPVSPTLH